MKKYTPYLLLLPLYVTLIWVELGVAMSATPPIISLFYVMPK